MSKFVFARTRKPTRETRALPSPVINKDLPALHVLQFQNAVGEPGIVLQFFSHFVFILGVDDQERAMRQSGFIDQRAAHENETFIKEFIDKGCVFVPQWLLTRSL